jgi:mycothiol S-conjugate amidase
MTPVDRAGNPLSILSVHAHPDDEASKGSSTIAKYAAEGVRSALVCATGGEAGDILNPAADTPEVRANLHEVRMAELRDSVAIIGYARLYLLGYHDSGMADTEDNQRLDNFANAPTDEVLERLVRIIRAERPQVVLTYPHPDHIRVHETTQPACALAGDATKFPEAGEPWAVSKIYETGFTRRRIVAINDACVAIGLESPFAQWIDDGRTLPDTDARFGTMIDVGPYLDVRRRSLLAHRTQVAADSFWMKLPDDLTQRVFPWEEFALVESNVDAPTTDGPEKDLFAGIRP